MSGPMYFNPTPEQIAASKASNCGMATPKDPGDCIGARCGQYGRDAEPGKPCAYYLGKPEAVVVVHTREGGAA